MFWIKIYEEVKNIKDYNKILKQNINEIKEKIESHEYQINNLKLDNIIWTKIVNKKIKEIEKIQKRGKKKK